MGVTQKSWFQRNRFCRVTPAQFIRYLKSFSKAISDINKPLRLWVPIWTLSNFRTFGSTPRETEAKVLFKKNENDMNIFNSYPYLVWEKSGYLL